MAPTRKVTLVGATGQLGHHLFDHLVKAGYDLTLLTRSESSAQPSYGQVLKGDFNDENWLKQSLQGQDALVLTISVRADPLLEARLTRAACEAGVKYIFLNLWGITKEGPEASSIEVLPTTSLDRCKEIIAEHGNKTLWYGLDCGFWTDYSLEVTFFGIDIPNRKASLWDSGEAVFHTTTLDRCGLAVAQILALPDSELDSLANGWITVYDFITSQKELLKAAQEGTNSTDADWTITDTPAVDVVAESSRKLAGGDRSALGYMLYASYMQKKLAFINGKNRSINRKLGLGDGLPREELVKICREIDDGTRQSPYVQSILQWTKTPVAESTESHVSGY